MWASYILTSLPFCFPSPDKIYFFQSDPLSIHFLLPHCSTFTLINLHCEPFPFMALISSIMAAAVYFAVVIFVLSNIRKESFASANSVCFSFYGEEAKDVQNSRICASVWVHKQEKGIHVVHNTRTHVGLQLLLLLAGDV